MSRFLFAAAVASCLSGCSVYEDIMRQDEDETRPRLSPEDASRVMELYIATGRYGVMLAQARDILRLPETVVSPEATPSPAGDPVQELKSISEQQVRVARELAGDTLVACNRAGVPDDVRRVACETAKAVPASMQTAVPAQLGAVASRDGALGGLVMRWWEQVCSTAPKAAGGEPHACAIE